MSLLNYEFFKLWVCQINFKTYWGVVYHLAKQWRPYWEPLALAGKASRENDLSITSIMDSTNTNITFKLSVSIKKYSESCFGQCHYGLCLYTECRGALHFVGSKALVVHWRKSSPGTIDIQSLKRATNKRKYVPLWMGSSSADLQITKVNQGKNKQNSITV
jgi:hypothetical protein